MTRAKEVYRVYRRPTQAPTEEILEVSANILSLLCYYGIGPHSHAGKCFQPHRIVECMLACARARL